MSSGALTGSRNKRRKLAIADADPRLHVVWDRLMQRGSKSASSPPYISSSPDTRT